MPTWIQYLPLEPEFAVAVVILVPILLFMWKLRRRIRAGEDGLTPVFLFWSAVVCLLACMVSVPTLYTLGFSFPQLPAIVAAIVALMLGPKALAGWRKEPRAVKSRLRMPDLGLDFQNILTPVPNLPGWELGKTRAAGGSKPRRVRAGRLDMRSVAIVAAASGFGLFWMLLWFTALWDYGLPAFLPIPACGVAILVFWRRLYRDVYIIDEEAGDERPSLDLPSGSGPPTLPHMPPPRFGRKRA